MRRIVQILLFIPLISLQARANAAGDEALVRVHAEKVISTWNAHDMKSFAKLFANDAQFVNVVGTWWKNRAEIEAAHLASHQTIFKASSLTGSVADVKWLRADVAVAHLAWALTGSQSPRGEPLPTRKGIMVLVLTREKDGWTIATAQNTDIVEGASVPPPNTNK